MLKFVRTTIANYYAEKAFKEISKGDINSTEKGLKYFVKGISILPPSEEKVELIRKIIELRDESVEILNKRKIESR